MVLLPTATLPATPITYGMRGPAAPRKVLLASCRRWVAPT